MLADLKPQKYLCRLFKLAVMDFVCFSNKTIIQFDKLHSQGRMTKIQLNEIISKPSHHPTPQSPLLFITLI